MWVWQFDGQWWRTSCQDSALAGRFAPWPSVAWPLKLIVSPTFQVKLDAGVSITGNGRVSSTTMGTLVVPVSPPGSVTLRPTVCVPLVVNVTDVVAVVASLYWPSLSRSQA